MARIGVLGTAAISGKTRRGIVASGNVVAAIASRDLAKAQAWAHDAVSSGDVPALPVAYGSYEELIADASIDACYVPLPCATHVAWVAKVAAAGKGVLVEKPTASCSAELESMVQACMDADVPIMDGTMFMHHARLSRLSAACNDAAAFGQLGRVACAFSFLGDDAFFASNIRTSKALEPFGCLGDLGQVRVAPWPLMRGGFPRHPVGGTSPHPLTPLTQQYCLYFGLHAFRWELPATARALAHRRNAEGVPMDVSATFVWPSGGPDGGPRTLVFDCAFTLAFRQWAELCGTKGVVRLDDFVISRSHAACEYEVVVNPGLDAGHSNVVCDKRTTETVRGCNQEAAMWTTFCALATRGSARFEPRFALYSLAVQACLDAAMESAARDGAPVPVQRSALFESLASRVAAAAAT